MNLKDTILATLECQPGGHTAGCLSRHMDKPRRGDWNHMCQGKRPNFLVLQTLRELIQAGKVEKFGKYYMSTKEYNGRGPNDET